MTESELTDLGFNKVEVKNLESQNGYDYYYYTFEVFNNLTLISIDSDRVENGNWYVYNLEWPISSECMTKNMSYIFLKL